jgi:hypothetical protein
MKNFGVSFFVALLFVGLMTEKSYALFEVRVGGTYHIINPTDLNDFLEDEIDGDISGVDKLVTIHGDALFYLPMVPVGLGARYEGLTIPTQTSDDMEFDFALSRISFIANYRFIDTLLYFGPIVSVGLSHNLSASLSGAEDVEGETYNYDFKMSSTKALSYSVGGEVGIALGFFIVGAEVGYMSWKHTDLSFTGLDSDLDEDDFFSEVDLSGTYAKILVGFGF